MGGRREVSIISYRPVTRSDLKKERSFFRGSVSTFLQLVVPFVLVYVNLLKGFSFLSSIHLCKIKNLFMLSLCISNYGCTREVWRA